MITKADLRKHKKRYPKFNADRLEKYLTANDSWGEFISVKQANDARYEDIRLLNNERFAGMCLDWIGKCGSGCSDLEEQAILLAQYARENGLWFSTVQEHVDISPLIDMVNDLEDSGVIKPRYRAKVKPDRYTIPERSIETALMDHSRITKMTENNVGSLGEDDSDIFKAIRLEKRLGNLNKFHKCLLDILDSGAAEYCTERNFIIKLEHPTWGRYYYYYKSNWGKKAGAYHKFRTNSFPDFWDKVNSLNAGVIGVVA